MRQHDRRPGELQVWIGKVRRAVTLRRHKKGRAARAIVVEAIPAPRREDADVARDVVGEPACRRNLWRRAALRRSDRAALSVGGAADKGRRDRASALRGARSAGQQQAEARRQSRTEANPEEDTRRSAQIDSPDVQAEAPPIVYQKSGAAGARMPPIRTAAIFFARPPSSVSTATPQSVAGPSAGSKRAAGMRWVKRRRGSSLSMPITDS